MFGGMFPFNSNNNMFMNLFNDNFIDSMFDQIMNSTYINGLVNEMVNEDEYDIEMKDYGEYYLIKGYLPGIGPKDVSIDFEPNKAILTIKKKRVYSNGSNVMMTVVQSGGNLIKTFYIGEVDVSKMQASFNNNLLLLTIPKVNKIEGSTLGEEATIIDVDAYKVE